MEQKQRHKVMHGHPNLGGVRHKDVPGSSLNLFGQPSH